jgi:hypothetical protein
MTFSFITGAILLAMVGIILIVIGLTGILIGTAIRVVGAEADRPHDPQQGSAQGEGEGAGESGFHADRNNLKAER